VNLIPRHLAQRASFVILVSTPVTGIARHAQQRSSAAAARVPCAPSGLAPATCKQGCICYAPAHLYKWPHSHWSYSHTVSDWMPKSLRAQARPAKERQGGKRRLMCCGGHRHQPVLAAGTGSKSSTAGSRRHQQQHCQLPAAPAAPATAGGKSSQGSSTCASCLSSRQQEQHRQQPAAPAALLADGSTSSTAGSQRHQQHRRQPDATGGTSSTSDTAGSWRHQQHRRHQEQEQLEQPGQCCHLRKWAQHTWNDVGRFSLNEVGS